MGSRQIFFNLFVIATALAHALLEIQAEGKYGWAEKLPTRKFTGFFARIFSEHKYITGFHLATTTFIIVFAHLPVFFVSPWTLGNEMLVVGFVLLHTAIEDFLWFVFNPHFGIHKFNRKHIWWHKRWFLGLPAGYWIAVPIGMLLVAASEVF